MDTMWEDRPNLIQCSNSYLLQGGGKERRGKLIGRCSKLQFFLRSKQSKKKYNWVTEIHGNLLKWHCSNSCILCKYGFWLHPCSLQLAEECPWMHLCLRVTLAILATAPGLETPMRLETWVSPKTKCGSYQRQTLSVAVGEKSMATSTDQGLAQCSLIYAS